MTSYIVINGEFHRGKIVNTSNKTLRNAKSLENYLRKYIDKHLDIVYSLLDVDDEEMDNMDIEELIQLSIDLGHSLRERNYDSGVTNILKVYGKNL